MYFSTDSVRTKTENLLMMRMLIKSLFIFVQVYKNGLQNFLVTTISINCLAII